MGQVTSLDTAYVTSLSWYFLVMFGMRGLYSIVLGAGAETDDTKLMQQQMGMGGPGQQPGQQAPDMNKIFAGEVSRPTYLLTYLYEVYMRCRDHLRHPVHSPHRAPTLHFPSARC